MPMFRFVLDDFGCCSKVEEGFSLPFPNTGGFFTSVDTCYLVSELVLLYCGNGGLLGGPRTVK